MKTLAASLVGFAVAASCLASTAQAGSSVNVARLQRQVTALQKQVTTLKKDVTRLKKQVKDHETGLNVIAALTLCNAAITADSFQASWSALNNAFGRTVFGSETSVDDQGLCRAFDIPRPQTVPPTLAPFKAMLGLLRGSFRAPAALLGLR